MAYAKKRALLASKFIEGKRKAHKSAEKPVHEQITIPKPNAFNKVAP